MTDVADRLRLPHSEKILIPLFEDYYLFNYLYGLSNRIQYRGYRVVMYVGSEYSADKVRTLSPEAEVRRLPRLVTFLNNRGRYFLFRLALYLVTFLWVHLRLRREFRFCIVPWTTRPVWNVISRNIPSLTINNVSNLSVVEDSIAEHRFDHDAPMTIGMRMGFLLDKLGIVRLRRIRGELIDFNGNDVLESLIGLKSVHRENGCNGVRHLCVMGSKYVENYREVGVDPRTTEISVVGNPSYEFCHQLHIEFDEAEKQAFLEESRIPVDKSLFSLFISPSSLSVEQVGEIMMVIDTIADVEQDAHFAVKLHPKTTEHSVRAVNEAMARLDGRATLFTQFKDDVFNAKLIKCSKAIVQKQSTLGFLALIFRVPILSYNLVTTDYHDDLFKLLGISIHSENEDELKAAVGMLNDPANLNAYFEHMNKMEEEYCRFEKSPCDNVISIIDRHFCAKTRWNLI